MTEPHLPPARIVALGGSGHWVSAAHAALDEWVLGLTGKARPRVCLIVTEERGGPGPELAQFYQRFNRERCVPSHLSFGAKPVGLPPLAGLGHHLLQQDVVIVAGEPSTSVMPTWRVWGLDAALADALHAGVLLCGKGAGALAWFETGLVPSADGVAVRSGLGFLAGACHVRGVETVQTVRQQADATGSAVASVLALDDGVAVLFQNGVVHRAVRAHAAARAAWLHRTSDGPGVEPLLLHALSAPV